jgi:lipoyl(octanoyl) transferase
LVGYPVFKLEQGLAGVRAFIERVEAGLCAALGELGVRAGLRPGHIGVWCDERKIASIGVAVKRRVTFHGFALNVAVDLDWFRLINPCGMPEVVMTSVGREGGVTDDGRVRAAVVAGFERVFGVEFQAKLPRILTSLTDCLKTSAIASTSNRA